MKLTSTYLSLCYFFPQIFYIPTVCAKISNKENFKFFSKANESISKIRFNF